MHPLIAQQLNVPVEVAAQVPGLYVALAAVVAVCGLLVSVVVMFLKHLRNSENRQDARDERQAETILQLGESCHTTQAIEGAQNRTMMAECATALKQNTSALASNSEVLRDVRDWVDEQRNKQ
jgi:hypothetical protein